MRRLFNGAFLLVAALVALGAFIVVLQIHGLKEGTIDPDTIRYYIE
jgi:hypothetical protein